MSGPQMKVQVPSMCRPMAFDSGVFLASSCMACHGSLRPCHVALGQRNVLIWKTRMYLKNLEIKSNELNYALFTLLVELWKLVMCFRTIPTYNVSKFLNWGGKSNRLIPEKIVASGWVTRDKSPDRHFHTEFLWQAENLSQFHIW